MIAVVIKIRCHDSCSRLFNYVICLNLCYGLHKLCKIFQVYESRELDGCKIREEVREEATFRKSIETVNRRIEKK